jgi:hypothetical protein
VHAGERWERHAEYSCLDFRDQGLFRYGSPRRTDWHLWCRRNKGCPLGSNPEVIVPMSACAK